MIHVYHKSYFPDFQEIFGKVDLNRDYTLVASVPATCLESAFGMTNNMDDSWAASLRAAGVNVSTSANEFRSTSVGDILEHNGRFYGVCAMGFKEIEVAR